MLINQNSTPFINLTHAYNINFNFQPFNHLNFNLQLSQLYLQLSLIQSTQLHSIKSLNSQQTSKNTSMQQPQSSSTLNNYISGTQNNPDSSHHNHQSSSLCADCQHIIKIDKQSASESESSSSSGDDGQLVQPLHRHITEHSRQIHATITHLQQQIQKLNQANSSKDQIIEKLRKQLKQVQIKSKISQAVQEDVKETQFLRRQKQIQNIRKQIYQNTQNPIHFNNLNCPLNPIHEINGQSSLNEELRRRLKKVEVMFEDKSKSYGTNLDKDQKNQNRQISKTKSKHLNNQSSSSQESSDYQERSKKKKFTSSERQKRRIPDSLPVNPKAYLKAANKERSSKGALQTQNDFDSKESSIEYELNQYSDKITRLEQHVQFCQDEMLWMTNFIIAFLRMSEKLMGNFNQPILKEHWDMKKKTKVAWRYIKHILTYLIP